MTIIEVLDEITKEHKWYIGKLKQQNASALHRRIRLGKAKPDTIRKFFNTFGYYGEFNEWSYVPKFTPKDVPCQLCYITQSIA